MENTDTIIDDIPLCLHRNYRFRLYPTKEQATLLQSHFFASNQAWNTALGNKIEELNTQSAVLKHERKYSKFNDVYATTVEALKSRKLKFNSGVVQDELRKLDATFQRYYSRKSTGYGFPKFAKSSKTEQSFIIRNQSASWDESHFKVFRQEIKWRQHRAIPAGAKFTGGIIKRTSDGKYWVVLNLTLRHEFPANSSTLECGIDLNVENVSISDSLGNTDLIPLPNFSKSKYSKRYVRLQQQLSRRYKKKNFSKNTKRLQRQANKVQRKIKNCKDDFFHKLSTEIVQHNYGRITLEDLEIKRMKESDSTRLNRLISDVSWDSLIQKIKYKAAMQNVIVREIHPAYTSQRCNPCGYISDANRKTQSVFHCVSCNHTANADCNASLNILEYDEWSLEQKALISSWKISKSLSVSEDPSIGSPGIHAG